MFVGRWNPFHRGHDYIIRQKLDKGIPVLICIRDMEPDEKNPFKAEEVKQMLEAAYPDEDVITMIIPNIESIVVGRNVGYSVEEIKPPEHIKMISATDIRNKIKTGDPTWKQNVLPGVATWLESYYAKKE